MRLFLAIDIPGDKALDDLYQRLKGMEKGLGPVDPNKQHVTLKFLGDPGVSEEKVIESILDVGDRHEPFDMEVREAGAFSNWKRPSIFWLGLSPDEGLKDLATDLDRTLHQRIGADLEKRDFRAHITVARYRGRGHIRSQSIRDQMEITVADLKERGYNVEVDRFYLISSRLTPQGPIYTRIHTLPLKERTSIHE